VSSGPHTRPTVVVVTWQGVHLLGACLDSLRRQTVPHDVLVVDNASTDGTVEFVAREYPEVRVLRMPCNTGFAGGVQAGLDSSTAEFMALLNNDAVAEASWLAELLHELETHPEAGAVTSRMYLAGRQPPTLNNTGVLLLPTGYGADRDLGADDATRREAGEVFGFSGGAALLRAAAVRDVGGFPVPFFLYYEDTDTSWRLHAAGWTVRYTPRAVVHHVHSASTDQSSRLFAFHNERNRLLMLARCAPARDALRCWLRFALTTASLAVAPLRGRQRPTGHHFDPAFRLRITASAMRRLPWALRTRIGRPVWPTERPTGS
jgi:GT2 family glycosyltransferase